jgi:hypothetical protein
MDQKVININMLYIYSSHNPIGIEAVEQSDLHFWVGRLSAKGESTGCSAAELTVRVTVLRWYLCGNMTGL